MGRRKIEIKAIKEERNRSVTFLKRKGGLFKKAHELSVLCSVDIAVIIFGSNKKLYEYSSGDMSDILGRYSYYETPHEHKGPADYNKGGLDDDDEDIDMGSPPPEAHDHMQPQHMQHPGMQHINSRQGTGSASPPIHARNLGGYPQRNGTPQPGISRPSSRNAPRRISSSNLNPQQGQNGYSYMPGPPVYNHANQHQPMPQGINQGYQYNPNQQPQPQPQAPQQQYDDRRASMPPVFVQPPRQMPSENPPPIQTNDLQPPSMIEKMPAFKSRSIFTPIVGPDSELGKFMFPAASDNSRDRDRDHSNENNRIQVHRKTTPPPIKSDDHLRESPKQSPPRSAPLPPVPIEPSKPLPPPPTRSNSLPSAPAKRPTLTLTIPIDQQETEAPTGGSSPRDATVAAGAAQQPPTTRPSDAPAGSVVLPPPSPSVTLLSAGATGPVNPFAPRPATTSGPPEQTPLSALPSRFLPGEMLPSPSTFFSDWGATFGGRGGAGDMLPSPLNFQTPIAGQPQHNIFKEEPDTSSKRKSPSLDSPSDASANASTKKVKV